MLKQIFKRKGKKGFKLGGNKKGKTIATILGLFLLIGGLIVVTILVQKQQDIRKSASVCREGSCPPAEGQCTEIIVLDTKNNKISPSDLSKLKAGETIKFAVRGTSTGPGQIDKARFVINGETSRVLTTLRNRADGQYYVFNTSIPKGTTSFVVKGQLHHSVLGWKIDPCTLTFPLSTATCQDIGGACVSAGEFNCSVVYDNVDCGPGNICGKYCDVIGAPPIPVPSSTTSCHDIGGACVSSKDFYCNKIFDNDSCGVNNICGFDCYLKSQ